MAREQRRPGSARRCTRPRPPLRVAAPRCGVFSRHDRAIRAVAATWGCSQAVAARVPRRGTCAHTARRVERAARPRRLRRPQPPRGVLAAGSGPQKTCCVCTRRTPQHTALKCPAGARVPASHTNANQRIEARMRSEATAAFLRFVPSLPQKRPTQKDAFSFPGAHGRF